MHPSNTVDWPQVLDRIDASAYPGTVPEAPFWFGDSPELCSKLTLLVLEGTKTATASLLWAWEHEGEPIPKTGQHDVLLDWNNRFIGIIATTQIAIKPFAEITSAFARLEGEGNLSLEYWRKVHWRFFQRVCQQLDKPMTEHVPVFCQVFRLVYQNKTLEQSGHATQ
jgi:uncharacterized protein YhfF